MGCGYCCFNNREEKALFLRKTLVNVLDCSCIFYVFLTRYSPQERNGDARRQGQGKWSVSNGSYFSFPLFPQFHSSSTFSIAQERMSLQLEVPGKRSLFSADRYKKGDYTYD